MTLFDIQAPRAEFGVGLLTRLGLHSYEIGNQIEARVDPSLRNAPSPRFPAEQARFLDRRQQERQLLLGPEVWLETPDPIKLHW